MPRRKLQLIFRNTVKKISAFFLAGIFAVFVFVLLFSVFLIKINKIACSTQFGACPANLVSKMEESRGKSLFAAKKEIRRVLEDQPSIDQFSIRFNFPGILKADILMEKAASCIKSGDWTYMISGEGIVLSKTDACSLPQVKVAGGDFSVGEKINNSFLYLTKIIRGVYQMYQIGSSSVEGNSLVVELKPGLRVIFPLGEDDPSVLLGALRLIYARIESEGRSYREIDLRFASPVLR